MYLTTCIKHLIKTGNFIPVEGKTVYNSINYVAKYLSEFKYKENNY